MLSKEYYCYIIHTLMKNSAYPPPFYREPPLSGLPPSIFTRKSRCHLPWFFQKSWFPSLSPPPPPSPPHPLLGGRITLTMQHFTIRSTVYWWFILISGNESLNTHLSNFVSLVLLLYADYYRKIPYNNQIIKEKDLLTKGCNSNRTKMEKTWQNMRNLYSAKDSTFSMWQSCLGKV